MTEIEARRKAGERPGGGTSCPRPTAALGDPVPESFNATERDFRRDLTVDRWIAGQAEATPERVAIRCGPSCLSYAELNRTAGALAARVRAEGGAAGRLVGIFLERSSELVVGVLGVLKCGAAYVPMDPGFPAERLRAMVDDAGMALIVTQRSLVDRLPVQGVRVLVIDEPTEGEAVGELHGAATASDLAYVIFTSGSTGRPKGVRIRHRSLVNFLHSMQREPGMGPDDVLLAVTTLSFDIAGLELFLPLITGATVVLAARETTADGRLLRHEVERNGITVMQATPVTWRMLLEAGWQGAATLRILVGGEAVPRDLVAQLLPRCGSLWNMYGPTETTIWSTTGRLDSAEGPVTIGRPIDNTQVHIVDAGLRRLPIGETGELCIGGEGVADGYHNRPDLTAERFVPDPFPGRAGARLYRTGDLARWRPDGTLECLGRMDDQVKIRGHRIELGEIEAALRGAPGIREAAVAARADGDGGLRLVAYLVPGSGDLDVTGVRRRIAEALPDYMIPTAWVTLERLPLTPNGKLDRKALPEPGPGSAPGVGNHVSPATERERRMAALWEEVLKVPRVGMTDSFFDLGGHSLSAVRLFARIEKEFGRRLPLTTLFKAATPAGLLEVLGADAAGGGVSWHSLVTLQAGGGRPPLYCVHGAGGNLLLYRDLIQALGSEVPIHGFQSRGLDGRRPPLGSVEEMAAAYVEELTAFQPNGPYFLSGYCMGGTVAFEMARVLHEQGRRVAFLGLFDTYNFSVRERSAPWVERLRKGWQKAGFHASNLLRARGGNRVVYLREKVRRMAEGVLPGLDARRSRAPVEDSGRVTEGPRSVERINHEAGMVYRPGPCPVEITVFKPERNYAAYPDPRMGWGSLAKAGLEIVPLPLNPHAMLVVPFVGHLAQALRSRLERVWRESGVLH